MPNPKSQKKPVPQEITELAERYDRDPKAVLEVLKELDAQNGGLTSELITNAAHALGLPANRAFAVASFYSMLSLKPDRKSVV